MAARRCFPFTFWHRSAISASRLQHDHSAFWPDAFFLPRPGTVVPTNSPSARPWTLPARRSRGRRWVVLQPAGQTHSPTGQPSAPWANLAPLGVAVLAVFIIQPFLSARPQNLDLEPHLAWRAPGFGAGIGMASRHPVPPTCLVSSSPSILDAPLPWSGLTCDW